MESDQYIIAVDAMSGDYGLEVTVPAALNVLQRELNLHLILVGDPDGLQKQLSLHKSCKQDRLRIQPSSQVVAMDESPVQALRTKKDSSMWLALNLIKQGEAQACVSAGNTGALMAMARFILKTLPGVDRPAIVAMLPTMKANTTVRVLDLGANVDSEVEHLFQFAVMGSVLAEAVDGIERPTVGLLNIGSEAIKGNKQVKELAQLLLKTPSLNYVGYVEGDAIYQGVADIVVCDGFVGNIALKVTEGVAKLINYSMRCAFQRNWLTRLSGLAASHVLQRVRKQIDPEHYNGASFLGLQGIVIKSHGGANSVAFEHAINKAILEVQKNIPQLIRKRVGALLQDHTAD